MRPGEVSTIIGRTATFRGDLSSTDDLQIDGEFEGTIRLTGGRLTVGSEAHIKASIVAPEVVIYGWVEGDIRATGRVDLRSTAVVAGDIFAGRLSMEENASLSGQVDPSRASEAVPASNAKVRLAIPVEGTRSTPRTAELFNTETGATPSSGRQMPSALAAIAAVGRFDAGSETASPYYESPYVKREDKDGGSH